MILEQITAPATEPVSLQQVKQHLRLDHNEEDSLLSDMISAARMFLEKRLSLSFITSRWTYRPRYFGVEQSGAGQYGSGDHRVGLLYKRSARPQIQMPLFPVQHVHQMRLYLADGSTVLSDVGQLQIESSHRPALIASLALPSTLQAEHGLEIEFSAGYGDAPEDVPTQLRLAITMLAAYFYEHRIDMATCQQASMPASVSRLLMDYMEVRLK